MFGMDQTKTQGEQAPSPEGLPEGVIISPDTRREQRIPPGQSRTWKWPILDASGAPVLDLDRWQFRLSGRVAEEIAWSWQEFQALPRVKVFADFHCVTRWSRLGNLWEGVLTRELLRRAGGVCEGGKFAMVFGHDRGWTTNLPIADFLDEDALVAIRHDGEAISTDHGGPARLIIPKLYAWKSAKWVSGIEIMESDRAGFWEANGYHMRGDPWQQERYSF